jgi:TPR repeat protein
MSFIGSVNPPNKGMSRGQYNLGKLYARGIGVKASNATAAKWYRKAADQGNL